MVIKTTPLDYKIDGLRAFRIEPDPRETVTNDFEWYAVRNTIADNFIKVNSDAGSVGVIYKNEFNNNEFFLVPNFSGDGLTRLGVVDSFPKTLKAQMHTIGYFHGKRLMISDSDCAVIPRPDLEINRYAWYECFSRDGIVVFAKVK